MADDDRKGDGATKARARPLLIVGDLRGLTPSTLQFTPRGDSRGKEHPVDTSRIDFRRARGFDGSLRRAVAKLGIDAAADAEVVSVDSKRAFLEKMRGAGTRQVIYFGHAFGSQGIAPGGLSGPLVTDDELSKSMSAHAPRPILVGCHAGDVRNVGDTRVGIGLDRYLLWKDTYADLAKDRGLTAKDITITAIELEAIGKRSAPQQPLTPYTPGGPR